MVGAATPLPLTTTPCPAPAGPGPRWQPSRIPLVPYFFSPFCKTPTTLPAPTPYATAAPGTLNARTSRRVVSRREAGRGVQSETPQSKLIGGRAAAAAFPQTRIRTAGSNGEYRRNAATPHSAAVPPGSHSTTPPSRTSRNAAPARCALSAGGSRHGALSAVACPRSAARRKNKKSAIAERVRLLQRRIYI